MVMIVVYLGLFTGVFGMVKLLKGMGTMGITAYTGTWVPAYAGIWIPAAALAVTAVVFAGSYLVSLRIAGKREW